MAELLTTARISDQIESLISNAREFICLVCPYLYHLPVLMIRELKKADERGVKLIIIYKKGLVVQGKEIEKLQSISNLEIFCSERLHAKAYFNELEAIVTSYNLLSGEASGAVDFGVHFVRDSDPSLYEQLSRETEAIKNNSIRMKLEGSRLLEIPAPRITPDPKPVARPEGIVVESKKLNAKEKQSLILDLLAREAAECVVKVEDQERLRIQGPGIVVFTNKDRVETIFVRYAAFNARKDEIREFLQSQHPGLQVWVSYNRITLNVDKSDDVISLFYTMKHALGGFGLL